jgi:hypothetical protein
MREGLFLRREANRHDGLAEPFLAADGAQPVVRRGDRLPGTAQRRRDLGLGARPAVPARCRLRPVSHFRPEPEPPPVLPDPRREPEADGAHREPAARDVRGEPDPVQRSGDGTVPRFHVHEPVERARDLLAGQRGGRLQRRRGEIQPAAGGHRSGGRPHPPDVLHRARRRAGPAASGQAGREGGSPASKSASSPTISARTGCLAGSSGR